MTTTNVALIAYLLAFSAYGEVVCPSNISQNMQKALLRTVSEKWRSLTLFTVCRSSHLDARSTSLMKTLPTLVAHSCPSFPSWEVLVNAGISRSEHTVLLYLGQPALQQGLAWFKTKQHIFPHTTHILFQDSEEGPLNCTFPRSFYLPSVNFVRGLLRVCVSKNPLAQKPLWSELRSKPIIVECGSGYSFCKRFPHVVILQVLECINVSLSLRPTSRIKHRDINPEPALEPDVSLNNDVIFMHVPNLFNLSPFMYRSNVVFYAHRRLAHKQLRSFPPFLRFLFSTVIPVALAVLFFLIVVRALTKLTKKLLCEPDACMWGLLLSATLSRGYEVRSSEIHSHTRRLLISFWFLATTCIVVFLQSALTSSIAVLEKERIEFTLQDFLQGVKSRTVCACGHVAGYVYLISDPKLRDIQESFRIKTGHCHTFYSGQTCHQKIISGSHVGVIQETPGESFCNLRNVEELIRGTQTLGQALIGAFARKGFPLWQPFHRVVRRAIETGWFKPQQASDESACSRPQYNENTLPWYVSFLLLLVGYALSALSLIVELAKNFTSK